MYVKVTAGDHPGPKGDFLHEVHPPIYSDYVSAPLGEDAQWGEDGKLIHPGLMDFSEALRASINHLYMLEFIPDQTEYEVNKNIVGFRFVYWDDPGTGLTAVITTRRIFILSDQGKTIDRV